MRSYITSFWTNLNGYIISGIAITKNNEAIIKEGYAVVYKGGKYIKDEAFKRRLLQAQNEAKNKNRGLWSGPTKKIMEGME